MGGSAPKSQTTTTQVKLPDWLESAARANVENAQAIAARPYEAYSGQRIAGLSAQELASLGLADQLAPATQLAVQQQGQAAQTALGGSQAALDWGQQLGGLSGAVGDLAGLQLATSQRAQNLPAQATAFFNPYLENVEAAAIGNLERTSNQQRLGMTGRAAQAGAFGGDRFGVAEGTLAAETARGAGELSGQLRAQGYQQALEQAARALQLEQAGISGALAARTAQGQQLAGAGQLGATAAQAATQAGAVAGLAPQQIMVGAQGLQALGALPRQLEQALLEQQFQDWAAERDYPIEQLALMTSALTSTPYGGSSQVSRPVYGPSAGTSIASGALSGASAGAAFGPWGAAVGGLLGAGAGYLGSR